MCNFQPCAYTCVRVITCNFAQLNMWESGRMMGLQMYITTNGITMGIFNFMKYITNCDTHIRVNHKNMEIELGKPFQWDRMGIQLTEPMVGR